MIQSPITQRLLQMQNKITQQRVVIEYCVVYNYYIIREAVLQELLENITYQQDSKLQILKYTNQ